MARVTAQYHFRNQLSKILKQVTRKCELQRIFDSLNPGAPRIHRIEYALKCSKSKVLRRAVNVDVDDLDKCLMDIMKAKKIYVQKDPRFKLSLRVCLLQISGYKQLYLCVANLRKQPYDSNNEDHEEQLMELWNLLIANQALKSRITKQWGDIGFQGDDPKTDFRSMGMLGLVNLVYFSKHLHSLSSVLPPKGPPPPSGPGLVFVTGA
uniref:ELMO domain-containing protein 2-like n=1 Tax=Geotrypetes seraphini TaxID=260995 RepID=A0A6P8S075_GEOSA|nr:ELMO domain-containing protein 2-like [Geotrypetes seraphini]